VKTFVDTNKNLIIAQTDHFSVYTTAEMNGQSVLDVDGNIYNTVTIGNQIWMASNLKTTRYCNGEPIGTTTPATLDISNQINPKFQWAYAGDEKNVSTYGRLYTWYAINDSRGVCPVGWHVPSEEERNTLSVFLGDNNLGGKLKETGTSHWTSPNTGATNESKFFALPGGFRFDSGSFDYIGIAGVFWLAMEFSNSLAWRWSLAYDADFDDSYWVWPKGFGNSVRCIKGDVQPSSLSTTMISNITRTSAVSGGNIENDGGSPITARGVCWSHITSPTILNNKTIDGQGTGKFSSTLTGLESFYVYHVRAYATNNNGTVYGNQISFTTAVDIPTVYTSMVTSVTATTATCGGTIVYGGTKITANGVCWSTAPNPTISNNKTTDVPVVFDDSSLLASFISTITGLNPKTTYYVKAYATNS
jgi:uncharacterized protein (TIGR02145 family)